MQAAFVDIGLEKNSFLYVEDAVPKKIDEFGREQGGEKKSINQILHKGQEIVVQIFKEPFGSKGARVTMNLTFPGRYLVLLPGCNYIAISRRIDDENERNRLKSLAKSLLPTGVGAIIRTAAQGMSEKELSGDIKMLSKQWKRIQGKAVKSKAPSLLYADLALAERIIRDTATMSVNRILINNREMHEKMQETAAVMAPSLVPKIILKETEDPFNMYNVQAQIEQALYRKVWLKSGGYLIIDQVEALTVIDVNTGKYVGKDNLSATILRTNLEAATEISRQLRLRNIGGIIIVDFIDMDKQDDKNELIAVLEKEVKKDRTKVTVLGLTRLGLVEMTRKKRGQSLMMTLEKECPFCQGKGRVLSEASIDAHIRQEIKMIADTSDAPAIHIKAHTSVASYLLGPAGHSLEGLEKKYRKKITVCGDASLRMENFVVRPSYEEITSYIQSPVKTGQKVKLKIDSTHREHLSDGLSRVNGFIIHIIDGGNRVGQEVEVTVTKVLPTYAKAQIN